MLCGQGSKQVTSSEGPGRAIILITQARLVCPLKLGQADNHELGHRLSLQNDSQCNHLRLSAFIPQISWFLGYKSVACNRSLVPSILLPGSKKT